MAAQGPGHFYFPLNVAGVLIEDARDKEVPHPTIEDPVQQAWLQIPSAYFPSELPAPLPGQPQVDLYHVACQPYRGRTNNPSEKKPDVVVVLFDNILNAPGRRQFSRRDLLWIECKAPGSTAPNKWNSVLGEAVLRLQVFHPDRQVFLILAIGTEWLPFLWDPVTLPQVPLQMLQSNQRTGLTWTIDHRIRPFPANFYMIGNSHIDSQQSFTLNHWDLDAANVPVNLAELQLLEHVFAVIQAFNYQGTTIQNY
ncbi:hypothetical protein QBC44DRAFT_231736 [Cladorrhinum sp. PSN332]|nr:hypothetical protein QBC44DRAFT_231736 [Cladorrhinum sp. PSN332]